MTKDKLVEEVNKEDIKLEDELYNLRKECVDRFIKALEGIGYHAENINRSSSYFIFYMGGDSVINFNIKELPGWIFGLWLNILNYGSSDSKYIKLEFFTQFESDIDKFEPSRSTYVEHCEYDLNETGTKLDYNKVSKPEHLFETVYNNKHIKNMLDFIKVHPYRAWGNSYTYHDQYSIPWSGLRCWYEYYKHKYYIRKKNRIQNRYDKILIDWILKNMSKYFEGIQLCKLESIISPSYEFYAPLSKNEDLFSENGIYNMFFTEDECKDVLESTESSKKELELANKNKSLIDEYKGLKKKLEHRAFKKHVVYYPEVEPDILILNDKNIKDMRHGAEVEVKLGDSDD